MTTSIGVNDAVIPLQNHPLSLINYAVRQGLDKREVLNDTGITLQQVNEGDHYICFKQYNQLVNNVLEQLDDPTLGLEFGRELTLSSHGIIGFAAMSRATVLDALDLAVRYKKTVTPITRIHYEINQDYCTLYAEQAIGCKHLQHFFIETLFSSLYHNLCFLTGLSEVPAEFYFKYEAPEQLDRYRERLTDQLHFNQLGYFMRCHMKYLERPLALANSVASKAAEAQCQSRLEEMQGREGLICIIRDQLLADPAYFPSLEEVASRLHTSVSTLKRKLNEHDTTYQEILDDVRKELAIKYLSDETLTVDSIAHKLQFREAANFRRAFKKWTGSTPSDYRRMSLGMKA